MAELQSASSAVRLARGPSLPADHRQPWRGSHTRLGANESLLLYVLKHRLVADGSHSVVRPLLHPSNNVMLVRAMPQIKIPRLLFFYSFCPQPWLISSFSQLLSSRTLSSAYRLHLSNPPCSDFIWFTWLFLLLPHLPPHPWLYKSPVNLFSLCKTISSLSAHSQVGFK